MSDTLQVAALQVGAGADELVPWQTTFALSFNGTSWTLAGIGC